MVSDVTWRVSQLGFGSHVYPVLPSAAKPGNRWFLIRPELGFGMAMPTVVWEPQKQSSHHLFFSLERLYLLQTVEDLQSLLILFILESLDSGSGGILTICMNIMTMMSITQDFVSSQAQQFFIPHLWFI